MIVIEGPDLAGKTTLADALYQRITREERTRHPCQRRFTRVEKHFDQYWGYRECCQRDVIVDRFHMSHVVYRAIGGETHTLDPITYSMVDAAITSVGGIVVLIAPDPSVIAERYDLLQRHEMFDRTYILRVAALYTTIAMGCPIDTGTGVYRPKVDVAFRHGQPTMEMVDHVMGLWQLRQMTLDRITARRPGEV